MSLWAVDVVLTAAVGFGLVYTYLSATAPSPARSEAIIAIPHFKIGTK